MQTTTACEQDVDAFFTRYVETGDGLHLLWAIRNCAQYKMHIPDKIRRALEDALNRYAMGDAWTLDEAFGVSRPKNPRQSKVQMMMRRVNGVSRAFGIYRRVMELHDQGRGSPIDEELFTRIAPEFSVSWSTARKYYQEVKREMLAGSAET